MQKIEIQSNLFALHTLHDFTTLSHPDQFIHFWCTMIGQTKSKEMMVAHIRKTTS